MSLAQGGLHHRLFWRVLPIFVCFLLQPLTGSSLFFNSRFFGSHLPPTRNLIPPSITVISNSLIKFDIGRSFSSFFQFTNATIGHTDEMLSVGIEEEESGREENVNDSKEREQEKKEDTLSQTQPNEDNSVQSASPSDISQAESSNLPTDVNVDEEKVEEEIIEEYLPQVPEEEALHLVKAELMESVLVQAKSYLSLTHEQLLEQGWNQVYQCPAFSLYKQRRPRDGSPDGPVEYLMIGSYDDVSPQAFLQAQIHYEHRKQWDTSTKEMSESSIRLKKLPKDTAITPVDEQISLLRANTDISDTSFNVTDTSTNTITTTTTTTNITNSINQNAFAGQVLKSNDVLYYRTKWPWPLKDRDYLLARR